MTTRNTRPAAQGAAGSVRDAFSWQATRSEYAPEQSSRQAARGTVTHLAKWGGRAYAVRYNPDDPYWRVRALAALSADSDAAYAVRAIPPTPAERAAFAVWAERELYGNDGDAP